MPIAIPLAIAGSAIVGASISASAAKSAANTQAAAANRASDIQRQMYDQTRTDLQPYRDAGQGAIPILNNLLTGNPKSVQSQLEQLPGYQFTRTQGLKAVQNSAAARGLGVSGAALKGASTYATGLANSTYGDQVGRLQNYASLGENAAAQTGTFGVQTGQNIGNNIVGAGNAQAAGQVGAANAISGAFGSLPNALILNKLLGSGGGAGMYAPSAPAATGDAGYLGTPMWGG